MENPPEVTSPNQDLGHLFKKFQFKGGSSTVTHAKENILPLAEDAEEETQIENEEVQDDEMEGEEPMFCSPKGPSQQSFLHCDLLKKSQPTEESSTALWEKKVGKKKKDKGMEIDEPSPDSEEDEEANVEDRQESDGDHNDGDESEGDVEMALGDGKLEETNKPLGDEIRKKDISKSACVPPVQQTVGKEISRPAAYSVEVVGVPVVRPASSIVRLNSGQIGAGCRDLIGPAVSSGRVPSSGLSRNLPKKAEDVLPNQPRRSYQRILQLLLGEVEPEKCTSDCSQCGLSKTTKSFHTASKSVSCAQLKEQPVDSSDLGSFRVEKSSAVPQNEQAQTRQQSVLGQNGAGSKCSSLKMKRPYEADDPKDRSDEVHNQTKYRTSLYRSAASFTPSISLPKKTLTRGQKIQVVAKKPTVFPFWRVMYANPSSRKNKIWEDDGTLAIEGNTFILRGSDGKEVGRATGVSTSDILDLAEGKLTKAGPKEVMLLEGISMEDYHSGEYLK